MSNLDFHPNYSLNTLNTLGLESKAELYCAPQSVEQALEAIDYSRKKGKLIQILGGGSNLLLPQHIAGLVLHPANQGIDLIEDGEHPLVRIGGGENWHYLVEYCLQQGWYGLENLALIPGNVGAAPIQNIGAYGVELKDLFHSLEALHLKTGEQLVLSHADCQFGYRDSIFKKALAGQLLITSVSLRLHRAPTVDTRYPALQQALINCEAITPWQVAKAVISIRQRKLPDPATISNVGSFFKNPVVSADKARQLRDLYPQLVSYPLDDGYEKLAAAWLIDQAGWKGKRVSNVGVHSQQALVLVNFGGASRDEILELAASIQRDIDNQFGIQLDVEPQSLLAG